MPIHTARTVEGQGYARCVERREVGHLSKTTLRQIILRGSLSPVDFVEKLAKQELRWQFINLHTIGINNILTQAEIVILIYQHSNAIEIKATKQLFYFDSKGQREGASSSSSQLKRRREGFFEGT